MAEPRTSTSSKIPQEKIQNLINLYEQGAFEEILSKVERLIELFPKEALLFNIRGLAMRNVGDLEAAIVSYKHAISLQPDYAEPYLNMGYALSNKGDLDEAIDSFKHAIRIKPDYAEAYLNMGNVLRSKGDMESAIECSQKAIMLQPDLAEAYVNMGISLEKKGAPEAAVKSYKQAINIDPNYKQAYYNLGNVLTDRGDLKSALKSFQRVIDLEPNSFDAYCGIGKVQKKMMHLELALDNYNKALIINPNHLLAYDNLSFILRHYIWSLSNKLIGNIENFDNLIELEQQKLRSQIKKFPLWFVDIAKTSSTAIKVLMGGKYGWPFGQNDQLENLIVARSMLLPDHTPAFIASRFISVELWKKIDTLAVVRNPYRWCSSLWHHAMKYHDLGFKTDTFDNFLGSFEEKLEGDIKKRWIYPSSYRQIDYILDAKGKIMVKNLLRLEDREAIDTFLNSRGILGYSKTHLMQFGNETSSSEHEISIGEKKKIERIFKRDFEILGY